MTIVRAAWSRIVKIFLICGMLVLFMGVAPEWCAADFASPPLDTRIVRAVEDARARLSQPQTFQLCAVRYSNMDEDGCFILVIYQTDSVSEAVCYQYARAEDSLTLLA